MEAEIVEEKLYWQIGAYFLVYICVFYELFRERLGHHLQKTNFLRLKFLHFPLGNSFFVRLPYITLSIKTTLKPHILKALLVQMYL